MNLAPAPRRLSLRSPVLFGEVLGRPYAHAPSARDALRILTAPEAIVLSAAQKQRSPEGLDREAVAETEAELLRLGYLQEAPSRPSAPPAPDRVNIWVHLSNDCNLDCGYCYIKKSRASMEAQTLDKLLASLVQTAESGVERVHLRFAGGEPMLRFAALAEFFDRAAQRLSTLGTKLSGAIITNGTVWPRGAQSWLKERGISVSVSMDGPAEVHDRLRPLKRGGGSFARVLAGLDALVAADLRPYVLITLTPENLSQLPALVSLLLERRIAFRMSPVREFERAASVLEDSGPPELRERMLEAVFRVYDLVEADLIARGPWSPGFRFEHKFADLELWAPLTRACGAGHNYLAFGADGQISPCHASLHRPGAPALDPSRSLLAQAASPLHELRIRRETGNPTCTECQYRLNCAGGCPLLLLARGTSAEARSPYCELFRAVMPRLLRVAALELLLERHPAESPAFARRSLSRAVTLGPA